MADSRTGIELDGSLATLVTVTDGAATTVKAFPGTSPSHALTLALAAVNKSDRVRVALAAPGQSMRRVDVTAAMMAKREVFEDAVYTVLPVPREGTTAAGLFFEPDLVAGALGSGVGALAPAGPVQDAYAALGPRRGEVVPPPFTFVGHDGLHLFVRNSTADLTLVAGGFPVAYRQLRAGGLDVVSAPLGDGATDLGSRRLAAVLNEEGPGDPVATAELDRYLRTLAGTVGQLVEHWRRGGEDVPEQISILGPGSAAVALTDYLSDVGLTVVPMSGLARAMSALPPQQRPAAAGAFLAATSLGENLPAVAFPNPAASVLLVAAQRRSALTRKLLTAAAAAGVAAALIGTPVAMKALDLNSAKADRAAAAQRLGAVSEHADNLEQVNTLQQQVDRLAAQDARWSQVVAVVYSTATANGVSVNSVAASSDALSGGQDITVQVSASFRGDFTTVTRWIASLEGAAKAKQVATSNVTDGRDGNSSVTLSFTLTLDQVPVVHAGTGS